METSLNWRRLGLPVYIVLGLLIAFVLLFIVGMLTVDTSAPSNDAPLSADGDAVVEVLLANADPANGALLVETYDCTACHRAGVEVGIAPSFVGIAERAAERRPPLSAAAYLYESITAPDAYVLEGYSNSMVQNYDERITDDDIGDIIAYLLTPDAR
ncbi:MAG: c-type cytochrome [Chloroflexi bacterium]|nr:c-type cytochrome [Chloroflexota bacterium]